MALNVRRPTDAPTCTVVVPTLDRPEHLDRCLAAVVGLSYPRFDVLVVDNGSRSASDVAARWDAGYTVEPVRGVSRARNTGVRASGGDIIAFLDDDALPDAGWLAALVDELEDPLVLAATGRVLPLDPPAPAIATLSVVDPDLGAEPRRVDRSTPYWFEIANFGGLGIGCGIAFRRQAFDVIGGFDERLGRGTFINGAEEHFAFFKLIDAGYRVAYTPRAIVRHPFPETERELYAAGAAGLAHAAQYTGFLVLAARGHRMKALRYGWQGLRAKRRPWRGSTAGRLGGWAARWRVLRGAAGSPPATEPAPKPAPQPVTRLSEP